MSDKQYCVIKIPPFELHDQLRVGMFVIVKSEVVVVQFCAVVSLPGKTVRCPGAFPRAHAVIYASWSQPRAAPPREGASGVLPSPSKKKQMLRLG